jgi:hypothetical protein
VTAPDPPRLRSPWPVAAWALVFMILLAGWVAISGDVLSPSVVLDVVALWPVGAIALPALVLAVVLRRRRGNRGMALPPLFVVTWLIVGLGLHLAAWERLPSAVADLDGGPATGIGVAELALVLDGGSVDVSVSDGRLFEVRVPRAGGDAGAPSAVLFPSDGRVEALVTERTDSRWYRFPGWDVLLDPDPRWRLRIRGFPLRADLDGLELDRLDLEGRGRVELGAPSTGSAVFVDGAVTLVVPGEAAVEVLGQADVPESWVETADGWRSPVEEGPRWTVTVGEGSVLRIDTR